MTNQIKRPERNEMKKQISNKRIVYLLVSLVVLILSIIYNAAGIILLTFWLYTTSNIFLIGAFLIGMVSLVWFIFFIVLMKLLDKAEKEEKK